MKITVRVFAVFIVSLIVGTYCLSVRNHAAAYMLPDDLYGVEIKNGDIWVSGAYGRIFHSKDGVRWRYQETGVDVPLVSIAFLNGDVGYAVGYWGTIVTTTDGGNNWKKVPIGTNNYLTGVYFIDQKRGFIIGEFGTLMTTMDGGKSWKQMLGKGLDVMLNGVDFHENHGWVVGEFGTVFHSGDFGKTWSKVDIKAEEYTLFGVNVVDSNKVVITGVDGLVFLTKNGGKTWEKKIFGRGYQLYGVKFNNSQEGYVFGKGLLLETRDGGDSFNNIPIEKELEYGWIYRMKGNIAVGKGGKVYAYKKGKWMSTRITNNISKKEN